MNCEQFWEAMCVYLSTLIIIYYYIGTIAIILTSESPSPGVLAGLVLMVVNLAIILICCIRCLTVQPGEPLESIDISSLAEEKIFKASDFIVKTDVDKAKVYTCSSCNVLRLPHARHCNVCNRCIFYRYNHSCLFRKCIGLYNFKFFTLLAFYLFIGSTIIAATNYVVMKNIKAPSYDLNLVFMFMLSAIAALASLLTFLSKMEAAGNISIMLSLDSDVYGDDSWYENCKVFFGDRIYKWFLPIKISQQDYMSTTLKLKTYYGGIVKIHDKYII